MRGVGVVRSVSRAGYQRASTSQNGRNVVHEIGHPFYASPPNGSNHCTRSYKPLPIPAPSVHIKQTPNPATLFPSPPPPILFFSVVVAASHAAFFQALPLSFSPSVVGPAFKCGPPSPPLPPLSSSPSPPSVILALVSPRVFCMSVILAFSPLCHPRNRGSPPSVTLRDPGFFACIPAPSHGATPPHGGRGLGFPTERCGGVRRLSLSASP